MNLKVLDNVYKVVKVNTIDNLLIEQLKSNCFFSITKTNEEISLVIDNNVEVLSSAIEDNWKIIKIEGVLDFSLIGILSKISTILADNNISIFVVSTFNTDYILVKQDKITKAIDVLKQRGYQFL